MDADTFEADPMFWAAAQRDYTLDEGSPAIDAGSIDCAGSAAADRISLQSIALIQSSSSSPRPTSSAETSRSSSSCIHCELASTAEPCAI